MDTSAATPSAAAPSQGALLEELGWLRTLARRLLSDPNDVEDVVQEAWLKTHEVASRFPSRGRLRAWLTGLVHRMARDTLRARRRRERREGVVAASARQDAEDGVERLAALESLLHTVRMLDEPLRAVVLLRYLDGHSTSEIAAALQISEDLVRKRLSRGRAALRRALGVNEEAAFGRRLVLGAGAVLVLVLALGLWTRDGRWRPTPQAPRTVEAPAPAASEAPALLVEAPAAPAHEAGSESSSSVSGSDSATVSLAEAEPPAPSEPTATEPQAPAAPDLPEPSTPSTAQPAIGMDPN